MLLVYKNAALHVAGQLIIMCRGIVSEKTNKINKDAALNNHQKLESVARCSAFITFM